MIKQGCLDSRGLSVKLRPRFGLSYPAYIYSQWGRRWVRDSAVNIEIAVNLCFTWNIGPFQTNYLFSCQSSASLCVGMYNELGFSVRISKSNIWPEVWSCLTAFSAKWASAGLLPEVRSQMRLTKWNTFKLNMASCEKRPILKSNMQANRCCPCSLLINLTVSQSPNFQSGIMFQRE